MKSRINLVGLYSSLKNKIDVTQKYGGSWVMTPRINLVGLYSALKNKIDTKLPSENVRDRIIKLRTLCESIILLTLHHKLREREREREFSF